MEEKSEPMITKIVAIGPESTGKSMLCQQLAQHYHTTWVPEYAREFLLKHGTDYSYDDLVSIAKGQLAGEDEIARQMLNAPLFIDTDMYVMKVWCEFVFGACHQWILDQIVERKYDLYLLCNPDIEWVSEELREYPDLQSRTELYHIYRDIMVNQQTPWVEIRGNYDQRLAIAVSEVDKLLLH